MNENKVKTVKNFTKKLRKYKNHATKTWNNLKNKLFREHELSWSSLLSIFRDSQCAFMYKTRLLRFHLQSHPKSIKSNTFHLLKLSLRHNHYKTLGIREGAPKDQIKKAYINLTKKYHPTYAWTGNLNFWDVQILNFVLLGYSGA